ncbi:hypothetical protein [Lysobacter tyrosinilyticus]
MGIEWSNRDSEFEGAEKHVAATLAAALIARGFNMPAASNTTMAAAQAVDIYRRVLGKLRDADVEPDAE